MNPADWPGGLAYVIVFLGPVVETEVVLVGAIILVAAGKLNVLGVLVAGALGGSAGDQFWYYALRGRLGWVTRVPWMARRHDAIVARVRHHSTLMPVAIRFLPGLRIAIAAACAYAGVPPLKFTLLNVSASFAWVGALMAVVAWGGPALVQWIGLRDWWGLVIPAVLFVAFFNWLARSSGLAADAKR
jgi:membrane protein DedA with SNARE-associated domain